MAGKATKHQQELAPEPQAATTEAELLSFFRNWARLMSEAEVLWTLALKTDEPIVVRWLANRAALERVGRIDKALSSLRRLGMALGAKAESPESPVGRGAALFGVPTAEHQNLLRDHVKRLKIVQRTLDDAYGISDTFPSHTFVDESIGEGYISNMDEAARAMFQPAADYLGLPVEVLWKSGVEAREKAARETTVRARVEPRPETQEPRPNASAKVESVFGEIPPEFRTKRHTTSKLPADVLHDPAVVQTAREIVNANRRTKVEALDREAREKLRIARRIVRANESPRPAA